MFYYDCECKDIKKNLNFQIFTSKNKKPSVSRQSVSKTNYLKTNLLKQIKKYLIHKMYSKNYIVEGTSNS